MFVLVIELDAGVGLLAGVEVLGVCVFFCLFLVFADEFVDVVLLVGRELRHDLAEEGAGGVSIVLPLFLLKRGLAGGGAADA